MYGSLILILLRNCVAIPGKEIFVQLHLIWLSPGIMLSYITEWDKHIYKSNMADMDEICEDRNTSDEALEQPEGILQLIDKLENIVDQLLPG